MSRNTLKIVLWIAFTVLFFVVFCGVQFFVFGEIDWMMAFLFFIVLGIIDKKGIGYLVEYYVSKRDERAGSSAQ